MMPSVAEEPLPRLSERPLVARAYSVDEMKLFVEKQYYGLPEMLGKILNVALSIVMHAMCLAITLTRISSFTFTLDPLQEFLRLASRVNSLQKFKHLCYITFFFASVTQYFCCCSNKGRQRTLPSAAPVE